MSEFPTAFRVAQVIGITGSAWLSGNICALSTITIPALLRSNQGKSNTPQNALARQWKTLYNAGKAQNPPIAVATASSFLYLAWAIRSQNAYYSQFVDMNTGMFYCGAAVLTLGIVPWTLVAMMSTNDQLESIARSEAESSVSDGEFDRLMGKWQVFNGIRGLFPLAGGVLGLMVALF